MLNPRFEKIFDLAPDEIFASGGDGSGYIGSKYMDYFDVVAQFEIFLKENKAAASIFHTKRTYPNSVCFSDNSNESISFGPPLNNPPIQEFYLQIY